MVSDSENQIEMKEIKLDLVKLRQLPIKEQRHFVFILLMHRDLIFTMKLMDLVLKGQEAGEVHQAARASYTFFLLYLLIGKIIETKNFLKNENLCQNHDDLPDIFKFIRDKLAFHYESKWNTPEVEDLVQNVLNDMKEFKIWASPQNYSNTIYQGMEETIIKLILKKFGDKGTESFEELLKETMKQAKVYEDKLSNLLDNFLENDIEIQEGVTVSINAPKLSKISIPLLIS